MSLGAGALKVSGGGANAKSREEVSMATLECGNHPNSGHQLVLT